LLTYLLHKRTHICLAKGKTGIEIFAIGYMLKKKAEEKSKKKMLFPNIN
jgi:hypothetical protein